MVVVWRSRAPKLIAELSLPLPTDPPFVRWVEYRALLLKYIMLSTRFASLLRLGLASIPRRLRKGQ
jgi:hypothetical protein